MHAIHTTRFSIVATTFLALLTVAALPAGAQMTDHSHEPPPQIVVNGAGEVQAAPDEATVQLGVVAQSDNARQAQSEASRIAGAILAAVARLGVPEKAVQTSQLVLTPRYEQPDPQQRGYRDPRIVGYEASNVVSIRLEDLTKIGPVIDAGIEAGANRVDGVGFGLKDDAAARRQALEMAVAEARAKASTLASAAGVSLGPILEIQESGVAVYKPQMAMRGMVSMEARMAADTPVSPGEITVSANVMIRYRIGG